MAKGTAGKNYWALLLMILAGVVLGGFIGQLSAGVPALRWLNYGQETDEEIKALAKRLKANYPDTRFYTSHCTGDNVYDVMKDMMGEQLQSFRCGTIIE